MDALELLATLCIVEAAESQQVFEDGLIRHLGKLHVGNKNPSLACVRLIQQHADLFTPRTDTMRSTFAQQNHLRVLYYVIERLNFIKI